MASKFSLRKLLLHNKLRKQCEVEKVARIAMYYVYLLRSLKNPLKTYVGDKTNVQERLKTHNSGSGLSLLTKKTDAHIKHSVILVFKLFAAFQIRSIISLAVVTTGGAAGAISGALVAGSTGGASLGATVVGGAIAGAGW